MTSDLSGLCVAQWRTESAEAALCSFLIAVHALRKDLAPGHPARLFSAWISRIDKQYQDREWRPENRKPLTLWEPDPLWETSAVPGFTVDVGSLRITFCPAHWYFCRKIKYQSRQGTTIFVRRIEERDKMRFELVVVGTKKAVQARIDPLLKRDRGGKWILENAALDEATAEIREFVTG